MRMLIVALAFALGCVPAAPVIEMADVSPVWPLPETAAADADGFLTASAQGGFGVLLPRDTFDLIAPLTRNDEPDALYVGLTVVGARLDPCFQEGAGDPPCQPNVRLVLQPIRPASDGGLEARDASLHAFFAADSADEIVAAATALAQARAAASLDVAGEPLGVNPLLTSADGRATVREALLPLLGAERLTRVTSIGVHADNAAWTFGGIDLAAGEPTDIVIPNTGGEVEQHALSDGGTGPIHASVQPALSGPDNIALLLSDAAAAAATRAERQAAFDAAARIENPTLNNPGTVDCVSCHLTAVARVAALNRETLDHSPDTFTSARYNLAGTPAFLNTQVVRAFGYRFTALALSPRVVHESAAVAARVDALVHAP